MYNLVSILQVQNNENVEHGVYCSHTEACPTAWDSTWAVTLLKHTHRWVTNEREKPEETSEETSTDASLADSGLTLIKTLCWLSFITHL